jgi:hypothetical protein
MTRRIAALVVALVCLLAMFAAPGVTVAQGANTAHLALGGGPAAGTYDLATDEPCREGDNGPGIWTLYLDETGSLPSKASFSFSVEPGWNQIDATFGDPQAGGSWYRSDYRDQGRATIDDRGDSVTLGLSIAAVHVYDAGLGRDVDVPGQVTVECHTMERRSPVPSYGGPLTAPEPGTWTGTITLHAVVDHHETEEGSDQDPNSTYYITFVREETVQETANDALTIQASDPADVSYGIGRVRLGGPAANEGATLQRSDITWQKQNSGCTWTEEDLSETQGSWTGTGTVDGTLTFSEDGTYILDVYPLWADAPELTLHHTNTVSNLSANCEGEGWQSEMPGGPLVARASNLLAEYDVNGMRPQLTGRLDTTDPGSVVAGSGSWEMRSPEDTKLTVQWDLVHDGPIVLPHS